MVTAPQALRLFLSHGPKSSVETRTKCQDFVTRYNFEIDSPFCRVKTTISVRQTKSLEDREGQQFAPLWRVWAERLKAFNVPALDARPQVFSIKDRKKRRWKPVFKLAPFGSAQWFALVSPDLSVPGILDGVLQRDICQTNMANVRWPPFRLALFRSLAGRGGFLSVLMGSTPCAHFNSQPDNACMMQHFAHGGSFA